jgi:hypothetical protein
MTPVKLRSQRRRSGVPQVHPYVRFLRRLRAAGRSNMFGAIPYLMDAFAVDRAEAFRIVCDFLDQEAGGPASPPADGAVA